MNILLINDTGHSYHWGCYGTAHAVKSQLVSMGATKIETIKVEAIHAMRDVPETVQQFGSKEDFVEQHPDIARLLEVSDYVVINGEGTIHRFHNAPRALLFLMYVAKYFFNKRIALINHSCFPIDCGAEALAFYRKGYQSCDFVAARESLSWQTINKQLAVKAELAFDSLPLSIADVIDDIPANLIGEKYICLSGAVNYEGWESKVLAKHIRKYHAGKKIIYLVGSPTGVNSEEAGVFASLKARIPDIEFYDAKSFIDWLSIIKHAELMLSGRYHYTIAAYSLGTKAIYFASNTPKIDAIAKDLGMLACVNKSNPKVFKRSLLLKLIQSKLQRKRNLLPFLLERAKKNYLFKL